MIRSGKRERSFPDRDKARWAYKFVGGYNRRRLRCDVSAISATPLSVSDICVTSNWFDDVYCCNVLHNWLHVVNSDCIITSVSPEVDNSPVYRKAAAESGSTATMMCKANGAPEVEFIWFKVQWFIYNGAVCWKIQLWFLPLEADMLARSWGS